MIEVLTNYINGQLKISKTNEHIDVFEPATGNVYARVPNSDKSETYEAILSAKKAFPKWSNGSVEELSLIHI